MIKYRVMEHNNFHFGDSLTAGLVGCVLTILLNLVHYVNSVNDFLHIVASMATIASACTTMFVLLYKFKKEK